MAQYFNVKVQFLTTEGEQEFEVKAASESPIVQVVTAE